jgi:hypothetical protein
MYPKWIFTTLMFVLFHLLSWVMSMVLGAKTSDYFSARNSSFRDERISFSSFAQIDTDDTYKSQNNSESIRNHLEYVFNPGAVLQVAIAAVMFLAFHILQISIFTITSKYDE